jgi:histidyl-tRNA synthetase
MNAVSGFPEWLPKQQMVFDQWQNHARTLFQSYGFWPIETPAVERLSTLLSKGDDHEIYEVVRHKADHNKNSDAAKKMGLRFDLTVPLARYVATHHGQLSFPFRRYHIGPVWRGERAQKGRYRQFYQCDIDVIGRGRLAKQYSGEMMGIMDALVGRLDPGVVMGPLHWAVSHRGVLTCWADRAGVVDVAAALRWIDKRGKETMDCIVQELSALGARTSALDQLVEWACMSGNCLDELRRLNWGNEWHSALDDVDNSIRCARLCSKTGHFVFDPLLARGLTYYSGMTYEAILPAHTGFGAVCAGGQYDHLTQSVGGAGAFPGVGVSLGLSRLFSCFVDHAPCAILPATVLVTAQEHDRWACYMGIADRIRQAGVGVETYLEQRPLSDQLKYANSQGHRFAVMANAQELDQGHAVVKNLFTRAQQSMSWADIPSYVMQ